MSITKKIPVIPECYKELKDSALLNSRDVDMMLWWRRDLLINRQLNCVSNDNDKHPS